MRRTPAAAVRAGILVVLVVVVQLSGLAQMRLLGGSLDLLPLVVGAVAIYAGSVPGAVVGFSTGLLVDLLTGETLGVGALVLTGVGYAVGRYRDLRDPAHGLMPIPVAAASSAGYLAGVAAVSFMLEIQAKVSVVVLREAVITTLLNIAVALPFFSLVRRVLRPVLVVDPLERVRRRARETAPAGPIGLRGLEVSRR